jgi:DNA-binding MarR family transcriptional regulator
MFVHELIVREFMEENRPLGVEIRMTSNLVKNYIDQTLEKNLKEKLTGIEGMSLGYIFRHQGEEITAKEIRDRSHSSKATISQTLSGLEKKGYIEAVPSPSDKRKKIIVLTPLGQKVQKEFREIFKGITAQVKRGISPEEEENVREILKKIQANVGGSIED